ncbi:hypothetical protein [Bosea vaviloviae]|uniref:hypothetical protein n=1 Tax=Bosea vaviloviae TaxID=1526658 RepID=UPI0006BAE876|nr:hypothetical protein [Bosea vaviloviae]
MPTNELLPFATAGGAGVMSQSDYAALAARLAGFVDGIAEPAEVNKVWRQSAFAAAMIGQFTADQSGEDTLDDGDVATFQANFTAAMQAAAGPMGQCQIRYVSATSIKLFPYGGNLVKVAGKIIAIPSGGISAANTSVLINGASGNLASSTAYLVALNASGGLEFWTLATGHGPDTTAGNVGVEVITGHADKTLVGMVYTNGSSQFVVSASNIGVISWHNRRQLSVVGASTAGVTTTSLLTYVELTTAARGTFITWGDETVDAQVVGQSAHGTAGSSSGAAVGIDVVAVGIGGTSASVSAGAAAYTGGTFRGALSEGPHTITPMGAVGNAGTGTFTVQAFANIRG